MQELEPDGAGWGAAWCAGNLSVGQNVTFLGSVRPTKAAKRLGDNILLPVGGPSLFAPFMQALVFDLAAKRAQKLGGVSADLMFPLLAMHLCQICEICLVQSKAHSKMVSQASNPNHRVE